MPRNDYPPPVSHQATRAFEPSSRHRRGQALAVAALIVDEPETPRRLPLTEPARHHAGAPASQGGRFRSSSRAESITTLSRDENPSEHDVYADDEPYIDPVNGFYRSKDAYDGQHLEYAPRLYETLARADAAGDLGNTYAINPTSGTVQRLHETSFDTDYVQDEGAADPEHPERRHGLQLPDGVEYHHVFDATENLQADNWQWHLKDLMDDADATGGRVIVQTQVVQDATLYYDMDGNAYEGCTCDDLHDESTGCKGVQVDDITGRLLMAKVEYPDTPTE